MCFSTPNTIRSNVDGFPPTFFRVLHTVALVSVQVAAHLPNLGRICIICYIYSGVFCCLLGAYVCGVVVACLGCVCHVRGACLECVFGT